MNGVSLLVLVGDLCLYDQPSVGAQKLKLAQAGKPCGVWNFRKVTEGTCGLQCHIYIIYIYSIYFKTPAIGS